MIDQPTIYSKKQGFSALFLFLIVFLLAFLHGFALMSDLPSALIGSVNFVFPFFDIIALVFFLRVFKENAASIGLQLKTFKQGMFWGFVFLCLQLVFYFGVSYLFNDVKKMIFGPINSVMISLFFISAFAEEIIYRGYIETRLQGLISNRLLDSIVTAILFVLTHYPVKWMGGSPLNAISIPHLILLVTLHFTCSLAYRKSNCIWAAVLLHVLYNLGNAFFIFI